MNIIWLSANRLGLELFKKAENLKIKNKLTIITLSSNAKTVIYDSVPKNEWYKFGKKVFEIERLGDELNLLKNISPDLIIMCGWREVINRKILKIPKKGIIGFHPTLLPQGRGPAPIINTILQGYRTSGLTMYYVNEGIDSGDIIAQEKIIIGDNDHASDVYKKIIRAGKKLISKYLPLIIEGKSSRINQDDSLAAYFDRPHINDNRIDFEKEPLGIIHKKIKAFSKPYRGAYIVKDGKKLILWNAELIDND